MRAISDETGSRAHAVHGHNQFIDAIRAQVLNMQNHLNEISVQGTLINLKSTTLNEPDADRLALFLSGIDPEKSMTKNSFDPATAASEIVELDPEETCLELNGTRNPYHASSSSNVNSRWKFDSADLENGYDKAVEDDVIVQGKMRYFADLINRFWHSKKYWHSRTFTKKRKDGEIMDDSSDVSYSVQVCKALTLNQMLTVDIIIVVNVSSKK